MTGTGRLISRRAYLRLSAAAIGALVASGCRDIGPGGVKLRFWNGFTGPDGRTILKIIRQFNQAHDDVQVVMQRMEWATYYNKLFVAAMGGRAPEVFVVHTDSLERFIHARLVSPIDDAFEAGGIDRSDIDANVIAAVERNGASYALPLDCHPAGMFYNRRLFADAGITRPPETRQQFIDALHKLKRRGDDGLPVWGFVYEWLRVSMYTLLRQWGGSIIGEDGWTITLDSPEAREAMGFAASLIHELNVVPSIQTIDAFLGFRQGRVGMVWAGIFKLQDATRQPDLDFGGAVVPVCGHQPAVWAGSHNLCLRNDLDERHRSAAIRFLRYLSDHTLDWAEGGQVPVRPSLRQTERFRSMTVQAEFARQIPYVQYMPSTPFTFEYQTEFDIACERVLRAAATPDVAIRDAAANMRKAAQQFARDAEGAAS